MTTLEGLLMPSSSCLWGNEFDFFGTIWNYLELSKTFGIHDPGKICCIFDKNPQLFPSPDNSPDETHLLPVFPVLFHESLPNGRP